jgi:hypothetical protein
LTKYQRIILVVNTLLQNHFIISCNDCKFYETGFYGCLFYDVLVRYSFRKSRLKRQVKGKKGAFVGGEIVPGVLLVSHGNLAFSGSSQPKFYSECSWPWLFGGMNRAAGFDADFGHC